MSNYKHGKRRDRVYGIWTHVISRCRNPNDDAWPQYGGRGIQVAERWLRFENFYEDMGDPEPGQSIERIDNEAGYCKENCKWASRTEQNRNRRSCRFIEINGKRATVAEWAEIVGVKPHLIRVRLSAGWSEFDAVMTPLVTVRKGIPRGAKLRDAFGAEKGVRFSAVGYE